MSGRKTAWAVAALACAVLVGGCETSTITAGSSFAPPSGWKVARHKPVKGQPPCRIGIGTIRDIRIDPGSMGSSGWRPVRTADSAVWIRAGFLALNADPRLKVADGTADADIAIETEIVKAHIMSITTSLTSTVILKLHFIRPGADPAEQVFRGDDVSGNWNSGEGETRTDLNLALTAALTDIDDALVARCTAPKPVPPVVPAPAAPAPVVPTPAVPAPAAPTPAATPAG